MTGATVTDTAIVEARGVGKTFGGRQVLKDVDLVIEHREIHALVGQNGSGKSTLIKILSGYHAPDPGATLKIRGRDVALPVQPDMAAQQGLRFVHQDLGLFEEGSVVENLMVGQYETRALWRIDWPHERRRASRMLASFGLGHVDPDSPLRRLSEVERAIVAIARALSGLDDQETALLVLDEPTARLPAGSVDAFFEAVRSVADRGNGVLFVSHRLDEVVDLADQVTVLRDGVCVERFATDGLTVQRLVSSILGFAQDQLYPDRNPVTGDVVVSVRGLRGSNVLDFDADVHHGEILGLTGLIGMGHDSVPQLLFGAAHAAAGTVHMGETSHELADITPGRAMALGMAFLPGNRPRDGAVGAATVRENTTLATLSRYFRGGLLRMRAERNSVRGLFDEFDVLPREPESAMATLSGGNQQKALIAKWLTSEPQVLLLDEPTHGVDVGAKKQILRHLRDAASGGAAVVIASVEAEDLAQLCHRVLVFRHGRVAAELSGGDLTGARISAQVQLETAPGGTAVAARS